MTVANELYRRVHNESLGASEAKVWVQKCDAHFSICLQISSFYAVRGGERAPESRTPL